MTWVLAYITTVVLPSIRWGILPVTHSNRTNLGSAAKPTQRGVVRIVYNLLKFFVKYFKY